MPAAIIFNVYLFVGGLAACAATYWFGVHTTNVFTVDILFIIGLLWANNRRSVETDSGVFSLNFPLLIPIMAFNGPLVSAVVAAVGICDLEELQDPLGIILYNRGSIAFSALLGGIVFHTVLNNLGFTLAVLLSAFCYSAVNNLFFLSAKAVRNITMSAKQSGFFYDVLENFKTLIPSAALGAIFYYTYLYLSVYGLIVSYLILLALRSQALFGLIDTTYRLAFIKSLLRAVWAKDPELMGHMERVAFLSGELARKYGYSLFKQRALDEACYFHDIGKLEIKDEILKYPGRLTKRQYETIKTHPERGAQFIQDIPIPLLNRKLIENIVLYHHERWDGTGYPKGLKGEEIPLEARIVAVADTWDAMTSDRCYKKAKSIPDAIEELKRVRGTQLDPEVVDVFLSILDSVLEKEQRFEASIPLKTVQPPA
ncbi:MAG: HD-GYP domain-containing protein [Firmicutes bacterium]|nr:HD-GYP domain-containing protein [Bacillota bacterium]